MGITFEKLLADPPKLHKFRAGTKGVPEGMFKDGELINRWKLGDEELRFIHETVNEKSSTLETGAGCSTVVFAMKGCQHTCVVPDADLVGRIKQFCEASGVDHSKVNFLIGPSEAVLPGVKTPIDMALIDGRHGFPQPFLDWYYVTNLLRPNGYVVIDDLHVYTAEELMSFLLEDSDWRLVHESLGGCAFQKLSSAHDHAEYAEQRYVWRKSRQCSMGGKMRYLKGLLRRGNYSLFSYTFKLGLQSLMMGKFGERPKGRR